jgi:hypothetical protein
VTTAKELLKVARAREPMTARYLRATGIAGLAHTPPSRSSRGRTAARKNGKPKQIPQQKYIYDSWRLELARLAKVNLADVAKPRASSASRG